MITTKRHGKDGQVGAAPIQAHHGVITYGLTKYARPPQSPVRRSNHQEDAAHGGDAGELDHQPGTSRSVPELRSAAAFIRMQGPCLEERLLPLSRLRVLGLCNVLSQFEPKDGNDPINLLEQ